MAYRQNNELPEVFKLIRLKDLCRAFIKENKIDSPKQARAIAWGRTNTSQFIESICELIGYCDQER